MAPAPRRVSVVFVLMETSINVVFAEAARALDALANRVRPEGASQRVFNGALAARGLASAYGKFCVAVDDMGVDLARAERVLQRLDARINGRGGLVGSQSVEDASIADLFDPTGGEQNSAVDAHLGDRNAVSASGDATGDPNGNFLMDLNLNAFDDPMGAKKDEFVDLDGIDMGSNLDELDLNLLDIPNEGTNEDPVDMDKLYDLIGLN